MSDCCVSSEDCCSGIDDDIIFNIRMTFNIEQIAFVVRFKRFGTQRDALIQFYVIPDDTGFADHNTGSVINEKIIPILARDELSKPV